MGGGSGLIPQLVNQQLAIQAGQAPQPLGQPQAQPQQPGQPGQLEQVLQQPGQFPQQPGQLQPIRNAFINAMSNQIDPQMMQRISMPQQPGFGGNQVYAGGTPNFDERTGTYINPQRPPVIQPGPGVFPQPRPQDSKRGEFRDMLMNRFQQFQDSQQRGLGGLQLNRFRRRLG